MSTKQLHDDLPSAEFLNRVTSMEVEFVEGGTPAFSDDAFQDDEDDDTEKMAKARIDGDAQDAQTASDEPPTEAQIHAGNYKKGHITVSGVDIAIENPAGTRRRPEWPPLAAHYGYVKRTEGADGDAVDVFVRQGCPTDYTGPVYIVDQVGQDGETFDEHKCLIGWYSKQRAVEAYLSNYTPGWQLGDVTRMSWAEFAAWVQGDDTSEPVAKGGEFDDDQHPRDEDGRFVSTGEKVKDEDKKGDGTGHQSGLWNRDAVTRDKDSEAYGGRAPSDTTRELKSLSHVTSPQAALSILSSRDGFKTPYQVSPELSAGAYGDTKDGGDYAYFGLSKEAAENAAVGGGVRFIVNAERYKSNAVVQPDQEGGIVLLHGGLPRDAIVAVHVSNPDSPTGRKVMQAWARLKVQSRRG